MNTQLLASRETDALKQDIHLHSTTGSAPVIEILHALPLEKWHNRMLKRATDMVISGILILLIFPWLFPVLAFLICLDTRGPVFFIQKRNKRGGKQFRCIKFRTMVVNEDADLQPACENDSRITKTGGFLRRYHLDELPQLFNVLIGDMSLVGPRPYMVSDNLRFESLVFNYAFRYHVKPGMTGLAQSHGHFGYLNDHQHLKTRIELDTLYIRTWSFRMDIEIMLRTLGLPFKKTKRYP